MNIEFKHLRLLLAIHETGSVLGAAEVLNLSQSSASHQIKYIREQTDVELFLPETRPLKLSNAGIEIVNSARKILPEVERLKSRISDYKTGQIGRLHIAIECHACFEWLFPVLNKFKDKHSNVDVDIKHGHAFSAMSAMRKGEIDLVISSDPEKHEDVDFHELFSYEPTFICAEKHRLADAKFVVASDFAREHVITYPVPRERIDLFSQLLIPNDIKPLSIREVELTSVILLLVGMGKGVTVLPDWVLKNSLDTSRLSQKPLTKSGLRKKLYAAVRTQDTARPYIQNFLDLSRMILFS